MNYSEEITTCEEKYEVILTLNGEETFVFETNTDFIAETIADRMVTEGLNSTRLFRTIFAELQEDDLEE